MAEDLQQSIRDAAQVDVICARLSIGALAAMTGLEVAEVRAAIRRQGLKGNPPRLRVALHNQTTVNQAIRRACRLPDGVTD